MQEEEYIMQIRKRSVLSPTKRNLYMWMAWPYRLFEAIQKVETGHLPEPARAFALGDDGKGIGPYQIQRVYWQDAIQHMPEIGGTYEDCRNARYAERIMLSYWDRYAPDDSYETLARIHNGGPKGHESPATLDYWKRVSSHLS